jgi:hypothetical protein
MAFKSKTKDLFSQHTTKKSKARRDKEDRTQEFSKTIKSLKEGKDDESMAVAVYSRRGSLYLLCFSTSRELMMKQKEMSWENMAFSRSKARSA